MAESQKARLVPRTNRDVLTEPFEIGDAATVGRHPSNTIVLGLDSISRFHARIDRRGSFYILQDLNSSNGTLVNGEKITQMTLHHRDQVTFGAIEFEFLNESASQSPTADEISVGGMSIVEFTDDDESDVMPRSKAVLDSSQIASISDKSSFFDLGEREDEPARGKGLYRRLSALYQLSELLRQAEDTPEKDIVDQTLDLMFRSLTADRGVIMTRETPEDSELSVTAVRHRDEPITQQRVAISRTILNEVMSQKVAVMTQDAQADDRFDQSESLIVNKVKSAVCVPMIQRGFVMGVVYLEISSEGRTFDREDLEFATMVANELSLALDNRRMRMEAAHRARLAAVGETVAGISHNVKNILLLMQGGSELLNRSLEKENMEGAQDSWGVVSRGIDRISGLVKDMLEYSSNKKPKLTEVDINEMICDTAEEIEDELIRKGVTLELDLEEELAPRPVDENGLHRTLMNLIVNAMEALPEGSGVITASTQLRPDDTLVIRIRDNGTGIQPDVLEKIFLPFFTTKGSKGTGLGLPMCKKVIEDMGGRMDVDSVVNEGTTFTMTIPRVNLTKDIQTGHDTVREEDD